MNDRQLAKRSGVERSAILLMSLGEQAAIEILKQLGAQDVQRVGRAMAGMNGSISRDEVGNILNDFSSSVEGQTSLGLGAEEYVKNVMVSALGAEKAANIINRMSVGRTSKGLESLKWMDARAVAALIAQEHPQIIAIVLAYLESAKAADVLAQLPEATRVDLVIRIAKMDGVRPAALQELDQAMEKRVSGNDSAKTSSIGGAKAAANIMNLMDGTQCNVVMDEIAKANEHLATSIQDSMFVFGNLIDIDDRGMQELLRGVSGDTLLLALKVAEEPMKEKVFKNMSQRAVEMLKDDMEVRGPVKLSDVETAQKEILAIARKMIDAGTVVLGGHGEEYV